MLKKLSYWFSIAVVGAVVGLSLQFAKAWTEPSVAPPGGNVGAPITTSSSLQTKSGPLSLSGASSYLTVGGYATIGNYLTVGNYLKTAGGIIANTGGAANGLLVQNGNVGIGTLTPGQKLSVAGTIETTSGGVKFPDGTVQTTAAVSGASQWTTSGNDIYNANSGNVGIGALASASNNAAVCASSSGVLKICSTPSTSLVIAPSPIAAILSTCDGTIVPAQATKLWWSTDDPAAVCSISGGWTGQVKAGSNPALSGSQLVTPSGNGVAYTLTCISGGLSSSKTAYADVRGWSAIPTAGSGNDGESLRHFMNRVGISTGVNGSVPVSVYSGGPCGQYYSGSTIYWATDPSTVPSSVYDSWNTGHPGYYPIINNSGSSSVLTAK